MSEVKLSLRNVRKSFTGHAGHVQVLDGLSFDIYDQDFVSIIGPSSCGKSTIFNIIAGLVEPDEVRFSTSAGARGAREDR